MQPSGSFSMLGMSGALPEYHASKPSQGPQISHQRHHPSHPAMSMGYQTQQIPHFADQTSASAPNHAAMPPHYMNPYQPATAQAFTQHHPSQPPQLRSNPGAANFSGGPYFPSAQPQAFSYYPGQYGQTIQPHHGPPGHQGMYPMSFGRPAGQAYGQGIQ